jgi:Flp pilus assembly protein TadG
VTLSAARGAGPLRRLMADASATTAIEFALLAPVMIAVALATLQAAVLILVEAFFETEAEAAARLALTNQVSGLTAAQFESDICARLTALFDCTKLVVELQPLPAGTANLAGLLPQFNASGALLATPPLAVGASAAPAGTDMLLIVLYPWPVYGGPLALNFATLGSGTLLMVSTQVFRTEP